MRRTIVLTWIMTILFFSTSYAITGLGIGVRGGIIQNYQNPGLEAFSSSLEAFSSSLSLERMPFLGAHLKIGTLPLVDLELSAEYAWKKKDVLISIGIADLKGDFTVSDFSLNATGKYHFLSIPVFKPYVGAGAGFHRLIYRLDIEGMLEPIIVPENESRLGLHAVAGIALNSAVLPFEVFVEIKYTHIKTRQEEWDTSSSHYSSILGGITMNF
jgi:hypothetical protein